jgi:hypothetical protein
MKCFYWHYLKSLHVYAGGLFGQSPFSSKLQLSAWMAWLISDLLPGESIIIPKYLSVFKQFKNISSLNLFKSNFCLHYTWMFEFPQHFIMSTMSWLFLYKFKAVIHTVSGTTGHLIVLWFQICLALKEVLQILTLLALWKIYLFLCHGFWIRITFSF